MIEIRWQKMEELEQLNRDVTHKKLALESRVEDMERLVERNAWLKWKLAIHGLKVSDDDDEMRQTVRIVLQHKAILGFT
jgi:hypothetical protein